MNRSDLHDPAGDDAQQRFAERVAFFESVLREWLECELVTIACGSWSEGGICELLPRGRAQILPPAYKGCFAGLRELQLEGLEHHMHIDLGRVHTVVYSTAPSVCFGGRPSFEARFLTTGAGGAPTARWSVSLMLSQPYHKGAVNLDQLDWFLERARQHLERRPDLVRFEVSPELEQSAQSEPLRERIREALPAQFARLSVEATTTSAASAGSAAVNSFDPPALGLLREALGFQDAALVIYRNRMLVEFQTEKLQGVSKYVEDGHVSWQIGAFHDHHCHLALGSVTRVLFSAEPVPCQRGRLNYTVWFLVDGQCGNPYRPDGYFSIVLNRPYDGDRPRVTLIEQVFELYRRYRQQSWVAADELFLSALERGPSGDGLCRA